MIALLTTLIGARAAKILAPLVWALVGLVALAVLIYWQRSDAVADYKAQLRVEVAERRLQDAENARETRHEIENMDDSELFDFLLGSVSRPDPHPRTTGEGRCDPAATVQPDGAILAQ